MEFSNEQKLIITLLTDIHAKLEIDDSVDPEFVQRMVSSDEGWALQWKYPGLFSDGETPPHVSFVCETLDLWECLEASYEELTDEQREELEQLAGVFGKNVRFPGFDGNNEHAYLGAARILINDLDRWERFKGRDLNSHASLAEAYRRMLDCYEELPDDAKYDRLLSVEELAEVLNERVHPANRTTTA